MNFNSKIIELLNDGEERSGAQIAQQLCIGSAKLYPALAQLEQSKVIASRWEDGTYPRRRLYKRDVP